MRTAILLVAMTAVLGAAAAPALASDESVYQAYTARDADFAKASKQVQRGLRVWADSNFKRTGPVLKALAKTRRLCKQLVASIEGENSETDAGERGKTAAIESVRLISRSTVAAAKGVRAGKNGRRKRSKRLLHQGDVLLKRSAAAEKRARKAFREAGVELKNP
jgi:hypothetical protein